MDADADDFAGVEITYKQNYNFSGLYTTIESYLYHCLCVQKWILYISIYADI